MLLANNVSISKNQNDPKSPASDEAFAGFQFVKETGDHKSSCKWIVKLACSGFIIGRIIRFNLDCNGQIAWRAVDRVGAHAGYGRTRGDAAFGLLCAFDHSCFGAYAVDSLVSPPQYTKKLQNDAARADLELSGHSDLVAPEFELSGNPDILASHSSSQIKVVLEDLQGGAK